MPSSFFSFSKTSAVLAGLLALNTLGFASAATTGTLQQLDFMSVSNGQTELLMDTSGVNVPYQTLLQTDNKWVIDLDNTDVNCTVRTDFSRAGQISHVIIQPMPQHKVRLIIRGESMGLPLVAFKPSNQSNLLNNTLENAPSNPAVVVAQPMALDQVKENNLLPEAPKGPDRLLWIGMGLVSLPILGALLWGASRVAKRLMQYNNQPAPVAMLSQKPQDEAGTGVRFNELQKTYRPPVKPTMSKPTASKPTASATASQPAPPKKPLTLEEALRQAPAATQTGPMPTKQLIQQYMQQTGQLPPRQPAKKEAAVLDRPVTAQQLASPKADRPQVSPPAGVAVSKTVMPYRPPVVERNTASNRQAALNLGTTAVATNPNNKWASSTKSNATKPNNGLNSNGDNPQVIDFLRNVADLMEDDGFNKTAKKLRGLS